MAKGVDWKRAQAKSLSRTTQDLYARYVKQVNEAQKLANELKQASEAEWLEKYPGGIDGKIVIFNAINGVLLFAYKTLDLTKSKGKKDFDVEAGENPFSPIVRRPAEAVAA